MIMGQQSKAVHVVCVHIKKLCVEALQKAFGHKLCENKKNKD